MSARASRMPEQHSGDAEAARDREAVPLTALLCPGTEGAGHLAAVQVLAPEP